MSSSSTTTPSSSSSSIIKIKKPLSFFSKIYLCIYNLTCIYGWSYLIYMIYNHFNTYGWTLNATTTLYKNVGNILKLVQTAAILEIFHSIFGLVPSPFFTTFLQGMIYVYIYIYKYTL